MLQAATQAIYAPCGHHIELAPRYPAKKRIKLRSLLAPLRPADTVIHELSHDRPVVALGDGAQFPQLIFARLVIGRNTCVQGDASAFVHGCSLGMTCVHYSDSLAPNHLFPYCSRQTVNRGATRAKIREGFRTPRVADKTSTP